MAERARAPWLLGIALAIPASAHALETEVDADTTVVAYEVRSREAGVVLSERRLVANLGVRTVELVGDDPRPSRRIRVWAEGRLRIDQRFGEDCLVRADLCYRAVDASSLSTYQPLAGETRVDVPLLVVGIANLPLGGEVRLGRLFRFDTIGMSRIDGLSFSVRPLALVSAEAYAGRMVRTSSFAGTSQFEVTGPRMVPYDTGALDGRPLSLDEPLDTWVIGGAIRSSLAPWLDVALDARTAFHDRGVVMRRASLAVSSTLHPMLRLEGSGVVDLLDDTVIEAHAAIDLHDGAAADDGNAIMRGSPRLRASSDGRWSVRASVERFVPRFDPGTIWAYFGVAPVAIARLRTTHRIDDVVELGAEVRTRHAELPDRQTGDWDHGVELFGRAHVEGADLGLRGFLWQGSLGPTAGVTFDASRRVLRELVLETQLSIFHFDDGVGVGAGGGAYGTVVSEVLGGDIRITDQTSCLIELQHGYADVSGHRFRALAALRLNAWR